MARLFGTNGIRGVFGEDLNLEFIHDITLCIAEYFKKGPILVGYDAVIIIPPAYPSFFVAYSRHGVGFSPAFLQSKPA